MPELADEGRLVLEKAQLASEVNALLDSQKLISAVELKRSQFDVTQQTKTYALEESRLQKLRDNVQTQLAVKKSRVTQLERALDRAKTQVADLKVVAGIRGIVQAIDIEVGQQLQPGSPIGRIARQDQLYAELKVPAREATQVIAGQRVLVDTRSGTYLGHSS